MRSQRLTPGERIKRRADFKQAYERGVRIRSRLITVFVLPNDLPVARLGVAASRKLGGAVQRNRAKRLVRAAFRQQKPAPGVDVVVVPQSDVFGAKFALLEAELQTALARGRRTRAR